MKILSFISFGNKGTTFESTLFDIPLKKFCKEKNHELINLDIEQLWNSSQIRLNSNVQQGHITQQDRFTNYVQQQVVKFEADVIIIPVGNDDNRNVFLPYTKGLAYVITRDYEQITEGFPGLINLLDAEVKFTLNSAQRSELKKFNGGMSIPPVRLFPPVNETMFYPDPDHITEDEKLLNDVSFFGRFNEKRFEVLKHLKDNGVEVVAYGEGWHDNGFDVPTTTGLRSAARRNASFQRHVLTRTKIGVVMDKCIRPIHFEIPACGALVVSNTGRSYFKRDQEFILPTFKTKEELLDVIQSFLQNVPKRKELAALQRTHVLERYTSTLFIKKLIRRILKEYRSEEKQ